MRDKFRAIRARVKGKQLRIPTKKDGAAAIESAPMPCPAVAEQVGGASWVLVVGAWVANWVRLGWVFFNTRAMTGRMTGCEKCLEAEDDAGCARWGFMNAAVPSDSREGL
jgi:hypothetical protein